MQKVLLFSLPKLTIFKNPAACTILFIGFLGFTHNEAINKSWLEDTSIDFIDSKISDDNSSSKVSPNYVPNIAVVMNGTLNGDCSAIDYTILIRNASTNSESLDVIEAIDINDPSFVANLAPVSGDNNNNGVLDAGESWQLNATKSLSPTDLAQPTIQNQVRVTSEVVGQPGVTTFDLSDDALPNEDDPTIVDISSCRRIGAILVSETKDFQDNSPGCATIEYSLTVRNTNNANESYTNVVITNLDPNLTFTGSNPNIGDLNNNGLFDAGESWQYNASRNLNSGDFNMGSLNNQVTVNAELDGQPSLTVSDLSDDNSEFEDDPTVTDLAQCTPNIISMVMRTVDGSSCDELFYEFEVINQSATAVLDTPLITSPLFTGAKPSFISGDDNDNNLIDPGEIWTFFKAYDITAQDLANEEIVNQASVLAPVVGQPGITAFDFSDDISHTEDGPTITNIVECIPNISLIKTGTALDALGNPGCEEIHYIFEATNLTNFNAFGNPILKDPLLGGELPGPDSGDNNNNNQIDPGETWTYSAVYAILQQDIDNTQVTNQATITVDVLSEPGLTITDLSDNNSATEDDPTTTSLLQCNPNIVSLVKTGSALDAVGGLGCEEILYQFEVTNQGTLEAFNNVVLTDPLLGGTIPGPDSGDDNNNAQLDPGETWMYIATYTILQQDIDNGQVSNQATVTADAVNHPGISAFDLSDDDSPTEDDPTVVSLAHCQSGISLIKKTGDGSSCDEIFYEFEVSNQGNIALTNVIINDPLLGGVIPGPISGDDDNDGQLDVNETWMYIVTYFITQQDINNGQVTNQATVTANVIGQPGATVSDLSDDDSITEDDPTVVSLANCPSRLSLIKTGSALDAVGGLGCEEILYLFEVTNQGAQETFDNVVLTDPLLGGAISGPDSGDNNSNNQLDPGETWVYSATYTITQQDIINTQVTNQAMVTADVTTQPGVSESDLSDDNSITEDDPTVIDLSHCTPTIPNIALIKTGSAIDALGGLGCEEILYTFEVTNNGSLEGFDNIVLTDPLLGGVISGPNSGDDNNNNQMDPGEIWIYSATYTIQQQDINNTQVTNQATVTADVIGQPGASVSDLSDDNTFAEDDPTIIDLSHCTPSTPSISLIKTGSALDAMGGLGCEEILYTFEVTNQDALDVFNNVVLTDPLLGGIVSGPDSGDDNNNNQMDSGEIWIYSATYAILQQDIDNAQVTNQATVTADVIGQPGVSVSDLSDNDSPTEDDPTIIDLSHCSAGAAGIALIKTGELVNGGCDTIEYTFTVTNTTGNDQALENVVLVDLDHPTITIVGPEGDTDNDGELDSNESWEFTATYNLTATDITIGSVSNQAQVTANIVGQLNLVVTDLSDFLEIDQNRPTDIDLVSCQNPGIGLIKQASLSDIDQDGCNESILYTFYVTNIGNEDLINIVVSDDLLNGSISNLVLESDINNDGILFPGETWVYEAHYGITDQDLNANVVSNQASVTAETLTNVEVSDLSDNNSNQEDDATTISVGGSCEIPSASIGLIKTGFLIDQDNDECADAIRYNFKIANLGGTPLQLTTLVDELLSNVPINTPESGDENSNNLIDIGEEWEFNVIYQLEAEDIAQDLLENQATVFAQTTDVNLEVSDMSDNDSYNENDPTIVFVGDVCGYGTTSIDFEIFTGISPNGDGINDYFQINGIENYPNNVFRVYNRWGATVYEVEGYGIGNKLFRGISEGNATVSKEKELPSGTYFYILEFPNENPGEASYSGYLYINNN
ncbi:gliding motility-associated C-terminal domain-containing protein [Flagellimonas pacifica]|uniref:Conserved repeat domain-containing protein/gliding motility-associated C-terminal domain-containing protein n=1 Tax=Flagellimonas pacifica TaxID=1247520 RepID=A0A285MVG4_9FLAO|nr:gliding motility-associated C-terminal domain-containing protein [Allomuricauda parva]SNY99786.1 conserved repeat domain-containing protein/gliding motility-associated C-terminal domain-containing protein [Allomuricauda parva]